MRKMRNSRIKNSAENITKTSKSFDFVVVRKK